MPVHRRAATGPVGSPAAAKAILMMTGFAFEVFISVLDVSCIPGHCFFMALVTGNICMLALQFEPGPVVIEIDGFPVLRCMARSAVFNSFFFELPRVRIIMTTCTVFR
jgi:hypothetical protein